MDVARDRRDHAPDVLGRARAAAGSGAACSSSCRCRSRGPCTSATKKRPRSRAGAGGGCRPRRNTIAPRSARIGRRDRFPWGDDAPDATPRQFDFASWEPVPVGARPAGVSAWGVHDLVGNGWEWTSTIFGPFAGFVADAVVSRVLRGFLRRPALRHEGGLAGDGRASSSAAASATGSGPTIPSCTPSSGRSHADDHPAVRRARSPPMSSAISRSSPKQLQSKYLYDASGLESVRRDLPAALVSHHAGGAAAASPRTGNRSSPRSATRERDDRRAGLRQRREAHAPRRGAGAARRARARAPDRHFIAGPRADGAAAASAAHVSVVGHWSTYEEGLRTTAAPRRERQHDARPAPGIQHRELRSAGGGEFLERIRAALDPGDLLLLGADLVKPERDLLLAYDDPLGVTAAFNRNLLVRINRELGGDFDLDGFRHRAVWNRA